MKLNTVYHHHHHLTAAAAIIPKKLNIGAGGHIPTILESILKQEDHPRGSINWRIPTLSSIVDGSTFEKNKKNV